MSEKKDKTLRNTVSDLLTFTNPFKSSWEEGQLDEDQRPPADTMVDQPPAETNEDQVFTSAEPTPTKEEEPTPADAPTESVPPVLSSVPAPEDAPAKTEPVQDEAGKLETYLNLSKDNIKSIDTLNATIEKHLNTLEQATAKCKSLSESMADRASEAAGVESTRVNITEQIAKCNEARSGMLTQIDNNHALLENELSKLNQTLAESGSDGIEAPEGAPCESIGELIGVMDAIAATLGESQGKLEKKISSARDFLESLEEESDERDVIETRITRLNKKSEAIQMFVSEILAGLKSDTERELQEHAGLTDEYAELMANVQSNLSKLQEAQAEISLAYDSFSQVENLLKQLSSDSDE